MDKRWAGVILGFLAVALGADGEMTLEERVSLCSGNGTMTLNAIPRIGIGNEWQFADSSHTVHGDVKRWEWGYDETRKAECRATVLPTLSALASTWNTALAAKHGDVLGSEARARGKDMILGPGINVMRTPLCGRNWEYMSEDPCLIAKMAVPLIRAIQKHDVSACVKHFACNNQELNRFAVDETVDERTLREIYLPGFRAAVVDGGVWAVMNAYNKINGTFCSENAWLQKDVLRGEWGFKGMVVTDWGSQHSCVPAALGGTDVEMNRGKDIRYFNNPLRGTQPLADAVRRGEVPRKIVEEMSEHVLWTMAQAGFYPARPRDCGERNTKAHQSVCREIGEEAVTLLKNDRRELPLAAEKTKRILVVGHLADAKHADRGWSAEGLPPYEITPLDALRRRLPDADIVCAPLCTGDVSARIHEIGEQALMTVDTTARDSGAEVRAWRHEMWRSRTFGGTPDYRGFMPRLSVNWRRDDPVKGVIPAGEFSSRWRVRLRALESGRHLLGVDGDAHARVRVCVDGKAVIDCFSDEGVGDAPEWDSTRVTGEVELERGREYDVAVDYVPGARSDAICAVGWLLPSELGMSQAEVRSAAQASDAVLVFTGTELGHGRALESEGADRPDLRLPAGHDEAIAEILSWKLPRTVVVNHSGAPVEMPWISDCPTLVQHPYLGQEAGGPLVAVLFGDVNPSGKLPCSWPACLGDTAAKRMGTYAAERSVYGERFYVGYRWHDHSGIRPMFPFGHGLSFSVFEYGEPVVMEDGDGWSVSVEIRNRGTRDGKETVQFYVQAENPRVERCEKDLRAFEKVFIRAGESAIVTVRLLQGDFAYWDESSHGFRTDAGRYRVLVAASAADIRCTVEIDVGK